MAACKTTDLTWISNVGIFSVSYSQAFAGQPSDLMAKLLNTSSVLMCPHGGTVMAITSNTRSKAGDFLLRASDTFTIAGCSFSTPGGPHPCVRVQWMVTALRCRAGGDVLLNTDSIGLCLAADQAPQGIVLIQSTQPKAGGQ
jgi:hypothetical protein